MESIFKDNGKRLNPKKFMQVYLQSMSNDITWGVEDNKDFYYDSLISK